MKLSNDKVLYLTENCSFGTGCVYLLEKIIKNKYKNQKKDIFSPINVSNGKKPSNGKNTQNYKKKIRMVPK
jgi:hypothetical protein